MAQDVTIGGASYEDVPAISVPITGSSANAMYIDSEISGVAVNVGFLTAADISSGTLDGPDDYMFAILAYCASLYSGRAHSLFIGSFVKNFQYHFQIYIYDTDATASSTYGSYTRVVPTYSNGFYYTGVPTSDLVWCGTNSGTFSLNTTNVKAANFYAGGHSGAIGQTLSASNTSVTFTTGAYSTAASLSLTPGVWAITGVVRFNDTTGGCRMATLNTASSFNYYGGVQLAYDQGSANTYLETTLIYATTSTVTMNLYGMQRSGSSVTGRGYIKAVRIA